MTARDEILGDIRRSLGRNARSKDARRELDGRLRAHKRNLVPARAAGAHGEQVALFVKMAEAAGCTVTRVQGRGEVPGAVADFLARHNLPTDLVAAPDPRLDGVPWHERPMLKLRRGRAEAEDRTSLTPAFAAVAETGTLVLISGAETPTTLNLLPENHVVVLEAGDVVGAYEDAWDRLRKSRGRGPEARMPRTVNLVTGPSRSGDIGHTLYMGAHGPRRLQVILVEEEPSS